MINFRKTRVSSHEGKKRDVEELGRAVKSEVLGEKQGRKAKGRIMKKCQMGPGAGHLPSSWSKEQSKLISSGL